MFLLIIILPITVSAKDITLNNASTEVNFFPNGGCTEAILDAVDRAKN